MSYRRRIPSVNRLLLLLGLIGLHFFDSYLSGEFLVTYDLMGHRLLHYDWLGHWLLRHDWLGHWLLHNDWLARGHFVNGQFWGHRLLHRHRLAGGHFEFDCDGGNVDLFIVFRLPFFCHLRLRSLLLINLIII